MRRFLRRYKVWLLIGLAILIVIAYYSSGYFFIYNNDAYVDANWVKLSFSVPGKVDHVYVKDNQYVKKGALLVTLDPRPCLLAVNSAKAQLDQASAHQVLAQIKVKVTQTDIQLAQARMALAKLEWQRYQKLLRTHAVAKEQ